MNTFQRESLFTLMNWLSITNWMNNTFSIQSIILRRSLYRLKNGEKGMNFTFTAMVWREPGDSYGEDSDFNQTEPFPESNYF
jgi:hypothetical protein